MPIQPAAVELLAALAPVLDRWGRWYVFGAQAVILYGRPRLSADVDVTLALEPDAPERFEDEFLDRAIRTDSGGVAVPVIDLADLIIAKVLAGRPRDLDDARVLWHLHGAGLDAGRIRRSLGLLEEALSQSDLVPAFDAIASARTEE